MRERIQLNLSLRLTADDWQLYTDKPHAESVARQINMEIARAINESKDWFDAFSECEKVLTKFAHYGANDTEPRAVLERLLRMFDAAYKEVT